MKLMDLREDRFEVMVMELWMFDESSFDFMLLMLLREDFLNNASHCWLKILNNLWEISLLPVNVLFLVYEI